MERLPFEIKQPIFEAMGVSFHPEQEEVVRATNRQLLVVGGERAGKSYVEAADKVPYLVLLPILKPSKRWEEFRRGKIKARSPDFVFFGPSYKEPKAEFEYVEHWLDELGKLAKDTMNRPSKPDDGPWRLVTTDGVVLTTWTLDDPGTVRSIPLEGAMIVEAGRCPKEGYERIRSRVSTTRGFIDLSGTMEFSEKWYTDLALEGKRENDKDLKTFSIPVWTNRSSFPGGENDPEILSMKKFYTDDIWAMRFAAEPRPPGDRVLKEFTEAMISDVEVPDDALWELAIDPGYASAYAVLFVASWMKYDEDSEGNRRKAGKQFHVAAEFYEQGLNTDDLVSLVVKHPLWPKVVKSKSGVMDIAGKGHRDSTESALEKWKKLTPLNFFMQYWHEEALRERLRTSAKAGQVTISPSCVGLIAEAGLGEPVFPEMHPWKYHLDRSGTITSEKPIDRWNHSVKALGYLLLKHLGPVEYLNEGPMTVNRMRKNKPQTSYFRQAQKARQ